MDITNITDKKELAYLLYSEQRKLTAAQRNCQIIETRIQEIELAESKAEAKKPTPKK